MKKEKESIEYYLELGMDKKTAEYFHNGRKTVVSVKANTDFTLLLEFDNGEKKIYDMKPILEKNTVFEPFIIYENFKRVYLDESHCICWDINPDIDSNVVWNNKVDISPDTCYIDGITVID